MKLKKILSICLVGAMAATLLTACGSSDETVGEEIKEDAETVVEDVKDVAEEAAEDVKDVAEDIGEGVEAAVDSVGEDVKEAAEEAVEDVKENASGDEAGDYGVSFEGFDDTITIKAYAIAGSGEGEQEVIDAINEISVPAINVELDMTFMDAGSYAEQIGLMFAGGESFDLVMVVGTAPSTTFTEMYAGNELMDISPYVDEYAPEALEILGEFADPFWMSDGGLYGLPSFKIYNSNEYIIMRADILDYLGLYDQAAAISSWSDYEAVVEAVYEAQDELPEDLQTPYMIGAAYYDGEVLPFANGFVLAPDDFSDDFGFDTLGNSNNMIIVEDGVVEDWYETDYYKDLIARVRTWYLNDWVDKDAANSLNVSDAEMKNGAAFSYMQHSQVGVEASKTKSTGYDVLCVEVCSAPVQTGNVTGFVWGVPVTSQEPEAAVAFLNLCYVNPEIENLLVYGIEGRDYELNDEGEAVVYDDYVYLQNDYWFPNQFNAYPAEGMGSDFRETALEQLLAAEVSPYYGFNIDLSPVDDANSALGAVITQYAPALNSGTMDASETYDEFIDAMYAAGLQEILDYYQQELDAWLAEQ